MIGHPLKINTLLEDIKRGDILLPEIQRAYVWKGPQVAKLLDSLYHNFPIGQVLLWDTDTLPITKNLQGSNKVHLPNVGQPKIILDGQQRLTSLYLALSKEYHAKTDVWFNLDTEEFHRFLRRMKADPRWLSVRSVINGINSNSFKIIEEIEEWNKSKMDNQKKQDYADRIEKLKKIGERQIPIEIFKSNDYEDATELFVRINSQGTRLRGAELVMAKLALRLPEMIVDKFEKSMEKYESIGFHLDTRFLTRALVAIGTNQSRFRYLTSFWDKSESEILKIWEKTNKAVDTAVNFVRHNAGFETSSWLPSLNTLIILSSYFNKYPRIAESVESGLLRWFYLASLRGRYSGSSETFMDEDLKAIKSDKPLENLMKNLKNMGRSFEVTPDEFDDAGWRNPLFPMTYAVVKKNHAKDWFSGVELSKDTVGKDNNIQTHHVFPKKVLKESGISRKDRDEIANLAFLSAKPNRNISASKPEEYLKEIANSNPKRLKDQHIPMDQNLWKVENFQKFLEIRRKLLAEAVNKLLAA